ncbi:hypothetical protein GCM10025782_33430 [Pedococcus ginsenosidimutans]|uniref:Uncharacterized protein n=1 Tax=Pedococcus ginsenosidimutans TaxID=490570 RepID=A0ABP8YL65_9MICO
MAMSAAGVMLATLMAAAPASDDVTLDIGDTATMVARGVALNVPVTYRCTVPYPDLYVHVIMLHDKRAVWFEGGATPVCDGTSRSVLVRVRVLSGDERFRPGAGLVQADLYWWPGGRLTASQEVRIVRGP